MRILFTGATGVIGRRAVPLLVDAGHEVVANVRNEDDRRWAESTGAIPVTIDLFDPVAVVKAVHDVDAVAHFATAIPRQADMPRRRSWVTNDRLRTEATASLVEAAITSGVEVFVQESITFVYADGGEKWLDENAPVSPGRDILDSALDAEREVARFTATGGRGVVMRMASLYGPGRTSGELIDAVSARKLPIVGNGDNRVSYLHIDDAATAVVAAFDADPGVYNVCDDEPVRSRQSLDALATALEVQPPRRAPRAAARVAAGKASRMLTTSQRVSNRRFKDATGWAPRHRSVLEGWPIVVAAHRDAPEAAASPG